MRLARLDRAGRLVNGPVSLRPFEGGVDQVEPTLVPFGDAIGVLWGRGSHINLCGGCVPDHSMLAELALAAAVADHH